MVNPTWLWEQDYDLCDTYHVHVSFLDSIWGYDFQYKFICDIARVYIPCDDLNSMPNLRTWQYIIVLHHLVWYVNILQSHDKCILIFVEEEEELRSLEEVGMNKMYNHRAF